MKYKYLKLLAVVMAGAIVAMAIYLITAQYQIKKDSFTDYKTGVTYPTSPITLKLWLPTDEKNNLDSTIDEFRKIHPSVTFETEYIDTASYQAKLLDATKTSTLPDLFVYRNDGLPLYKSALATAPESIFTIKQYSDTFSPFASQQLVSNNSIYGAPLGLATLGMIYNKDRFSQASITTPPTTWDEFQKTNDALRKKDGQNLYSSGVALGTSAIRNYPDIISVLMMQNGASMTNDPPTQATFQLQQSDGYQPSAKAVAFYASFAQPTKQNYSWSDNLGSSINALSQNKTALIVDYPMAAKQVATLNSNMQLGFAPLPQTNPSSPVNYGVILSGGVGKNTQYSEIAWDFWGFATSKTAQRQFSIQSFWPASRKDLIKEQLNDKDLNSFAKQSVTAKSWYKGVNYAVNADFVDMLNSYLLGLDAQTAVNNTAVKVTVEIQKSNQ